MLANLYTADTFWDLDKPCLPGRTQLLPLQPIGIGTLHVESLTGYIARLAQSHCLSTADLLLCEVLPLMRYRGVEIDVPALCRVFSSHHSLTHNNETRGDLIKRLLQALEELTGQQDVWRLSLLTEASELFAFSLLQPHQAWCPICYQEWRNDHRVVYTPLLWLLESQDVCLRHPNQALLNRCPYCQSGFLALTEQSCPGYCSKCHCWLGDMSPEPCSRAMSDDRHPVFGDLFEHRLHWEYWWFDGIEQVVANTSSTFLPPKQGPCKGIRDFPSF
jgi:hypothetical protein